MANLKDLLKTLLKNELKTPPRNVSFLEKNYNTWETLFLLRKKSLCKTAKSRLVAIQNLKTPTATKGFRSFVGMVDFLSLFFTELQKLLKYIYDLTRNGRDFWGRRTKQMFVKKLKGDYKNHKYYICWIKKAISFIFRY